MRYKNEGAWKTTGRPKEDVPVAAAKLLRCLQIINFLKNGRYSIQQIADRFDISERTVYRYLHIFEEVGLQLEQDFNNKFFLNDYGRNI